MFTRFVRYALAILTLLIAFSLTSQGALGQATPAASPVAATSLASATTWLVSQQQADGSWIGFSGTADPGVTIDAVLALAAAAKTGIEVDLAAATAYLEVNAKAYAETGPGQAAKVALVAVAIGADPTTFAGVDAIERMLDGYDANTDYYGTGLYDTALIALALGGIGKDIPGIVLNSIRDRQMEDGSWAFDGTTSRGNGDTNTTAILIQALVATGHTDGDMILHGLEYLQRSQLAQGFPFQPGPGAAPDANSTGIVIQALVAAGKDPAPQEWQNLTGSLMAFQSESGAFSYLLEPKEDNLFSTVQAIPALAAQPLPIVNGSATPEALPTCTPDQQATPVTDTDLPCAA